MKKRKTHLMLFLLTLFSIIWALSPSTLGQGRVTGTFTGMVSDQSGGVIQGAKVTVVNIATNLKRETVTGADGYYRIDLLPVGTYSVATEAAGFKKSVNSQINLSVNDILRIDFKLETGEISEVVTVSDAPPIVNTESSTLGKVVDNKTLSDLPVLTGAGGRNPLQLAPLQSGVVAAGQVGPFAVNGQRAQANNYMLDGGDSNDLAINVPDAITGFSPDALGEFRILTNTFSAEYGRNSGAVVNAISKSGGNQFHGNVFEFFRNRVLNSTPFFNNSSTIFPGNRNPKFNVNEYGGTLGGPVIKDKTFFFFSYEGFRRRQGVPQSATVFSDAERAAITQVGNPQALALLALVPRANLGANTFLSAENNRLNRDQLFGKANHTFSEKNQMFVSFFTEKQTFTDPYAFGGSTLPGFGTSGDLRYTNVVISDTYTISPNLVNEARASFHRRGTFSVVPVNATSPSALGISGIVPDDATAAGPPNVQITGISQFGNTIQGPQARYDNTYQFADNLSHRLGSRHFLKYGGDIRSYQQNQLFDFINSGLYVIQGGISDAFSMPTNPAVSDPVNDFANGVTTAYIQNSDGYTGYRTRSYNFYGQDDFKIKPYLTLNMGLRYELNTPLTDIRDQIATIRVGQQSTVFPTAPVGIVYPGDTGIPKSTYSTDYNNFAPRFGFAWDVLHNGKLSLRGGYGLYYDVVIAETTLQFLSSPPYAIQPNIIATTINNPFANSLANPLPQPFPFSPAQPGDPFDYTGVAPITITVNDPNVRTPYAHQYNMQVQYEFSKGYTLEVGYVGTTGIKLLTRREINPALVTPTASPANTDIRRVLNQNHPQADAFGGAVFGSITNQETSATSGYSSFQATVSKRFSKGFQFQNSYTYGHCLDNASGLRSNVRYNNVGADRGNCEFDIRHRYVVSYIWALPFAKNTKGIVGKALSGWQVAGVTQFQSGIPFNITEPTDRSLTNAGSDRPDYIGGDLQFLDPRNVDTSNGGPNRYFNATGGGTATAATSPFFRRIGSGASAAQGAGRFGTLGRNVFHGPGFGNWDFSLSKRTKVLEDQELEFRADFFNMFNSAQFLNPNGSIGSANFGLISTTRDPRLIQFALKYGF
jgi:carboxypeptidase family protein